MNVETQAALIGAVVGGGLSILATFASDYKKNREAKKSATNLFIYLNERWEKVEKLSSGSPSQEKDYLFVLTVAERIKNTIMQSGSAPLIALFLQFWSELEEANLHLQAGNLGLKGYCVDRARKAYLEFKKL